MKTLHSPLRTLVGLSVFAGLGMFGSSAVAQQTYCPSGNCPTTYATYAPSASYSYTYQRQAPATYAYQYQYQAPVAQYRYQYQAPSTAQYSYQQQAPATYSYQYQAPAATYQTAAAPAQYQQAAGTVQYSSYYHAAGATTSYQPATTYQTSASYGGSDPYGFLSWLNATRASYGLSAVGYDANLESWASANNGQQQARGLGHYVMGSARRQNSAMGSYSQIGSMWMNSPAHRAALLDPSIRNIGLSGSGSYWTFNAN